MGSKLTHLSYAVNVDIAVQRPDTKSCILIFFEPQPLFIVFYLMVYVTFKCTPQIYKIALFCWWIYSSSCRFYSSNNAMSKMKFTEADLKIYQLKQKAWMQQNIKSGSGRNFSIQTDNNQSTTVKTARHQQSTRQTRIGPKSPHAIALRYLERHPESYSLHREHYEQVKTFRYFELNEPDIYVLLAAMPNGGKRQRGAAGRIRAEGGKKGYPDILLDAARGAYHGCRIEMKSPEDKDLSWSAGTLRSEQISYLQRLTDAGYYCSVCYGHEDAIAVIQNYYNLPISGRMPHRASDDIWMYAA